MIWTQITLAYIKVLPYRTFFHGRAHTCRCKNTMNYFCTQIEKKNVLQEPTITIISECPPRKVLAFVSLTTSDLGCSPGRAGQQGQHSQWCQKNSFDGYIFILDGLLDWQMTCLVSQVVHTLGTLQALFVVLRSAPCSKKQNNSSNTQRKGGLIFLAWMHSEGGNRITIVKCACLTRC